MDKVFNGNQKSRVVEVEGVLEEGQFETFAKKLDVHATKYKVPVER